MKTQLNVSSVARWLLLLSLILAPNLAWGQKNKSSGGGSAPASHSAPPASHSAPASHPSGGGASTAWSQWRRDDCKPRCDNREQGHYDDCKPWCDNRKSRCNNCEQGHHHHCEPRCHNDNS